MNEKNILLRGFGSTDLIPAANRRLNTLNMLLKTDRDAPVINKREIRQIGRGAAAHSARIANQSPEEREQT